jgi:hypothetical protein
MLFSSWLSQNYFEAERQDELAYLSQAQLLISIEEGHLTQWFALLLVEQAKDSPNQEVLRVASLKAAQHQLNILTWATARVTDPNTHAKLLQDKSELEEKLSAAHDTGDTARLSSLLNAMTLTAEKEGPSLITASNNRYNKARQAESFWRLVFLGAYVAGSLLVGIGVLGAWKRGVAGNEPSASPNNALHRTRQKTARR